MEELYSSQDVSFRAQKQTAIATIPAAPNAVTIPATDSFQVKSARNPIDNPSVFPDGFEREFARGNFTSEFGGGIVPNLEYLPYALRMLGFSIVTSGVGPYTHVCTLGRNALYHTIEKGLAAATLYYQYLDMVGRQMSCQIPVEGIKTLDIQGIGTGLVQPAEAVSFDSTPTEVIGDVIEYASFAITEGGVDPENILGLDWDLTRGLIEKRPHGKGGKASGLRYTNDQIRLTLRAYFDSDALLAKSRDGIITPIEASVVQGANSGTFLFAETKFEPTDWEQSSDGLIVTLTGRSIKKASADAPIKITVVNTTPTYP